MSNLRWLATSLVLVVETRHCQRCGRSHRCPDGLFVQMESSIGGYSRTWLVPFAEAILDAFLPRRKQEIHTQVRACEGCFQTENESQQELWPLMVRAHYATATRIVLAEQAAQAQIIADRKAVNRDTKPKAVIHRIEDL